ncbi:MAG: hypothetical protein BECKG1743D_GA0114223_101051, partial [Candidatus Kentron sp. G]
MFVENSLEMLIYFHGNSAFSLPDFMTYGASLWNTIRLLHLPFPDTSKPRKGPIRRRFYITEALRHATCIAQPSRNGCRGPLGFAIDIATRYRKSRTGSIAIANRDIDSEP